MMTPAVSALKVKRARGCKAWRRRGRGIQYNDAFPFFHRRFILAQAPIPHRLFSLLQSSSIQLALLPARLAAK
jgi:hypothetical protein